MRNGEMNPCVELRMIPSLLSVMNIRTRIVCTEKNLLAFYIYSIILVLKQGLHRDTEATM